MGNLLSFSRPHVLRALGTSFGSYVFTVFLLANLGLIFCLQLHIESLVAGFAQQLLLN